MLKNILSISGKPGLYRLVSQSRNVTIVESIVNGNRMPAHSNDKIVSLGDISIYKTDGDEPLKNIMQGIQTKENGAITSVNPKTATYDQLKKYFAEVLPDFDRERVYPSDIKKIMMWYNLMAENGISNFDEQETLPQEEEKAEQPK